MVFDLIKAFCLTDAFSYHNSARMHLPNLGEYSMKLNQLTTFNLAYFFYDTPKEINSPLAQ